MSAHAAEDIPHDAGVSPIDAAAAMIDDSGGADPDFFIPARPGAALPLICRIPGLGGLLPLCR